MDKCVNCGLEILEGESFRSDVVMGITRYFHFTEVNCHRRYRAELDRLTAKLATLRSREQGTPLGRFDALAKWAEEELGHNPRSSSPFEVTIMAEFTRLSDENSALRHAVKDIEDTFATLQRERDRLAAALKEISETKAQWSQNVGSYAGGETHAGFAARLQRMAAAALSGSAAALDNRVAENEKPFRDALGKARTFMKYARYELEEKHSAFEQFPCQECCDKYLAIVDGVLLALTHEERQAALRSSTGSGEAQEGICPSCANGATTCCDIKQAQDGATGKVG